MKIKRISKNEGGALVLSIVVLTLITIVIATITNIYINKYNSVKNINDYYDTKLIEELNKRTNKSDKNTE